MPDKISVLIVDDEPDLLELMRLLVEEEGFDVVTAADGCEALQKFEICKPRIVITDINLPKRNGGEIITEIRKKSPATKIIIMSGGRCPPGADATVEKPIDFDVFTSLLKKLS